MWITRDYFDINTSDAWLEIRGATFLENYVLLVTLGYFPFALDISNNNKSYEFFEQTQ